MSGTSEAKSIGICSTCNNCLTCGYRALRGGDALFCEMFDDYVPSPNGGNGGGDVGSPTVEIEADVVEKATESEVYKGLCVNCEDRRTCRLARSEGGVWHCEEYR